jgi:uncharacterized lipoprotein YajG
MKALILAATLAALAGCATNNDTEALCDRYQWGGV